MTAFTSAKILSLGAIALALVAAPLTASASVFGGNLIVNGDAEASLGSLTGSNNGPTPGFTTTGDFAVLQYATGGGYPAAGDPGVSAGGANFFGGGYDVLSTGSQTIDVSSGSTSIDFGTTTFSLSALLGGYLTQGDNAVLSVTFLDGSNASVGSDTLGPVTAMDRNNLTGLLPRSDTGFVPIGTRSIDVLLTLSRDGFYSNDGYADNLSLVLTAGTAPTGGVPEPASWALMMVGFGGLGVALRARKTVRVAGI